MERFYIGTAEAIEAEFGAVSLFGGAFVVFSVWNNEPVCVEGFSTFEAAKASVASVEDRSLIEYI